MKEGKRDQQPSTTSLFERYVVPNYGRFPIAIEQGEASTVRDESGKEYVDFAAGIAVNSLGHCHPGITAAIHAQAEQLIHCSNLYLNRNQALLAEHIVEHLVGEPGKSFFCNSGAEANEALIKLARKYGHAVPRASGAPRFEIVTFEHSFHGRTMAGIAATGQSKVKEGFEPLPGGFKHVPFNDLAALRGAITPDTVAILMEPVQGEGGIRVATPEFLAGVAELCREHRLLLMLDEVQCGLGRTGDRCAWRSIEGGDAVTPDAVSWAKGMAGGLPLGAIWVSAREVDCANGERVALCDHLGPGTHGATFGGNPLTSVVALAVLEEIQEFRLWENAREQGEFLRAEIEALESPFVSEVRGLGLMIGIEIDAGAVGQLPGFDPESETPSLHVVRALMEEGLLTVGAGASVVRLLPALNLSRGDAERGIGILKSVLRALEAKLESVHG